MIALPIIILISTLIIPFYTYLGEFLLIDDILEIFFEFKWFDSVGFRMLFLIIATEIAYLISSIVENKTACVMTSSMGFTLTLSILLVGGSDNCTFGFYITLIAFFVGVIMSACMDSNKGYKGIYSPSYEKKYDSTYVPPHAPAAEKRFCPKCYHTIEHGFECTNCGARIR